MIMTAKKIGLSDHQQRETHAGHGSPVPGLSLSRWQGIAKPGRPIPYALIGVDEDSAAIGSEPPPSTKQHAADVTSTLRTRAARQLSQRCLILREQLDPKLPAN